MRNLVCPLILSAVSLLGQSPSSAPKAASHGIKKHAPLAVRFPLPLPKSYSIPQDIRSIIVSLYKDAPSIVEFREHYKLVYQDKQDLKSFLIESVNARIGEDSDLMIVDWFKALERW